LLGSQAPFTRGRYGGMIERKRVAYKNARVEFGRIDAA
jgi:hypothetical protein